MRRRDVNREVQIGPENEVTSASVRLQHCYVIIVESQSSHYQLCNATMICTSLVTSLYVT